MLEKVNIELKEYVDKFILPLYSDNIGGHGIDHIKYVIDRSFELIDEFNLNVDLNMVYVIAAFHDIGYKKNPEEHEKVSSEIFLSDNNIKKFFNHEQIKTIAHAIVDHRASLEYEPRSIYGKIVSSADRVVCAETTLERSILFQSDKHKNENPTIQEIIDYSYNKLSSKYGKGGYVKMYFQDQKYINYIKKMQELLEDKEKFVEAELEIIKQLKYDDKSKKLVRI